MTFCLVMGSLLQIMPEGGKVGGIRASRPHDAIKQIKDCFVLVYPSFLKKYDSELNLYSTTIPRINFGWGFN